MFSILPQNPQAQSAIRSKRQTFRNQIRRQKINNYKSKIRLRLLFDNQVDHDTLKNVNLVGAMETILKYDFPRITVQKEEIEIDNCHAIYDIEKQKNAPLKKAINDLFLYMTSKMLNHAINLMEEGHVFKLAEILERKTAEMKPNFKQKSYIERKTADDLRLPQIYQKVLIILTCCSYENTLFFEESVKYIMHVIKQVLEVFPRHTKVVQACLQTVAVALHNQNIVNHLLYLLDDGVSQKCLLTKFMDRRRIYKRFETLLNEKETSDELILGSLKVVYQIYSSAFGNLSQIVLESKDVLYVVIDYLEKVVNDFKEKRINEKIEQKIQITIKCFTILKEIFQVLQPEDEYIEQVFGLLKEQVEDHIDLILMNTLKLSETPLVFHALQLIKVLCKWGEFTENIYQNSNIIIKLFYFSRHESLKLKKQAICCLCNIIEVYLEGEAYHNTERVQIYQHLVQNFDFLDILVQTLDTYVDVSLNVEILNCIRILCYFWQADPQLGKYNRFWTKFVENGGELKLNTILAEDRNEEMKKIAESLLDEFVMTEVYEVEI